MSHNIFRNRRELGPLVNPGQLLATDYRRNVPVLEKPILTFQTNSPSTKTFDPAFTVSSGTLRWSLGDGSTIKSNAFSYTYADSFTKNVKVFKGTTIGSLAILTIDMSDDNIIGILNIS